MTPPVLRPADWAGIELVVFDVDGTLYNQRLLRLRMAPGLLWQTAAKRDWKPIAVLRTYRRIREQLADEEAENFEAAAVARTSALLGCPAETVRAIAAEWIGRRPLPYLARCIYPGVAGLFAGLRRKNKTIGILSDYPAHAKLAALGLSADLIVSAGDEGAGFLKPHPRGLEFLLSAAGVQPSAAVLIGDRKERDWLAAARAGVKALIRSPKPLEGCQTFARFDAPLFAPLLTGFHPGRS